MNIRRLINILIAIAILTMTTACTNYYRDVVDEVSVGDCYINLAISVSNGNDRSTRANEPAGGENGNGREAGFERENKVTGITLILYRTSTTAGINVNTGTEDPTLELVRYFPVTLGSRDAQGTTYSSKAEEAYYTTGNQLIGRPNLNLSEPYHAIVIANAPEVAASLIEGTSKLSDVRDVTLNTIYVGNLTKSADACTHFVMSSEQVWMARHTQMVRICSLISPVSPLSLNAWPPASTSGLPTLMAIRPVQITLPIPFQAMNIMSPLLPTNLW